MAVGTLLEKMPAWVTPGGADSAEVIASHLTLVRNIAGFPFPERCSEEEKRRIEERVLHVLEQVNLLSSGRYYHLGDIPQLEARLLAERRLITGDMLRTRGTSGVYVSDDQAFSVMVNGSDHVALRVIMGGQQLQEGWSRLNALDDSIGSVLDFTYSDRLGFLSSVLDSVGTGLKASVMLHLPGLVLSGRLPEFAAKVRAQRLALHGVRAGGGHEKMPPLTAPSGSDLAVSETSILEHIKEQSLYSDISGAVCGQFNEAVGDLFLLVNTGALGESEEEILFHLRHAAGELVATEREICASLQAQSARGLEDRVNRAFGIATRARLLGFSEGLTLLSSLRLGASRNVLPNIKQSWLNETLLASQGAHLEMAKGQQCDALTLSMERADLFRSRFGG